MFTSSEELSGRGQKTVESLTSATSVKARYARVSKVSAIDVTLSQENLEKVCSAMDGAAQALQGCIHGRFLGGSTHHGSPPKLAG